MDGCVGEDDPHKGMRAPGWVRDAAATAEVEDVEPKVTKSFVCFKKNRVGVGAVELMRRMGEMCEDVGEGGKEDVREEKEERSQEW